MNREQLKEIGLTDEQIEEAMKIYGKSVQELKLAKEELDGLKTAKSTLEQQLTDLQGTIDSQKDQLSSIDDLKQEIESYKLKDVKTNIAVQAGIPLELAGRLSGETEEEIKADAEKIAGFVNKKQSLPLKHTEPPKADAEESAYANMLDKL